MLLREQDDTITLFPAVPKQWQEKIEFRQLPISGNLRVSAKLQDEQGEAVFKDKNGQVKLKVDGKIRGFTITLAELTRATERPE